MCQRAPFRGVANPHGMVTAPRPRPVGGSAAPVIQVMLGVFDREGRVARHREIRVLESSPGTLGE